MPLPGYRNYQSLLALVPGATPPAFQNAVVDTPGRALRSFVNGTATNNNNTLVDGAVNHQYMAALITSPTCNLESIETVNISTGSFDAEYRAWPAAPPSPWLRSRARTTCTATGWWFNNNQHFNSDPGVLPPGGYTKPLAILNIFGGNIGGPIKKDKLFLLCQRGADHRANGGFRAPFQWLRRIFARQFQQLDSLTTVYDPESRTAGQRRRAHRFSPATSFRRTGSIPFSPQHIQGYAPCRTRSRQPTR
jgi:hypothetical protein